MGFDLARTPVRVDSLRAWVAGQRGAPRATKPSGGRPSIGRSIDGRMSFERATQVPEVHQQQKLPAGAGARRSAQADDHESLLAFVGEQGKPDDD